MDNGIFLLVGRPAVKRSASSENQQPTFTDKDIKINNPLRVYYVFLQSH